MTQPTPSQASGLALDMVVSVHSGSRDGISRNYGAGMEILPENSCKAKAGRGLRNARPALERLPASLGWLAPRVISAQAMGGIAQRITLR
jgi:hypothetical protein